MFQNKKLKRNATSAIAEVGEIALCASNCALPTSAPVEYAAISMFMKNDGIVFNFLKSNLLVQFVFIPDGTALKIKLQLALG